jgi:molybdopterin-guanine dinucleotide biosynthesis protein A
MTDRRDRQGFEPGPGKGSCSGSHRSTGAALPLRPCLLSGGDSLRMGRDKALLPHPRGGTWLERTLELLIELGQPVTLLSRHPAHRALARPPVVAVAEPPPWEGPLLALGRLMALHPGHRLLLAPVDMPWLEAGTLRALLLQADSGGTGDSGTGSGIVIAHDGTRPQPLLGLYPADEERRASLDHFTAGGGRSLLRWLEQVGYRTASLPAAEVRNCNRPGDWSAPPTGP